MIYHVLKEGPSTPKGICLQLRGKLNRKTVYSCLRYLCKSQMVKKRKAGGIDTPHQVLYEICEEDGLAEILWVSSLGPPASRQQRRTAQKTLEKIAEWCQFVYKKALTIDGKEVTDISQHVWEVPVDIANETFRAHEKGILCLECLKKGTIGIRGKNGKRIFGTGIHDPALNRNYCRLCGMELR